MIAALAGGVAGAAGVITSQTVVPEAGDALKGSTLPEEVKQLILAGVSLAAGAAAGGVEGALTGLNATANNYLTSTQWIELARERKGCDNQACRDGLDIKYAALSAKQDEALRGACVDLNSSTCRTLVKEATSGTTEQIKLVADKSLPDNYLAGRDFNSNVNLLVQKVQAQDVVNACNANPTQCDQSRLVGSARLLLTTATLAAAVLSVPALGAEVAAMAAMGGPGQYCAQRAQSCLNLINAVAEAAAGVPVSGVSVPAGPRVSGGTANLASVPGLKAQLAAENLANIAAQDSRLAAAVAGSGVRNPNFTIGTGSAAEAERLGKIWVGDGAQMTSNQVSCPGCLASADGLRIYRPPTSKASSFATTGVQANFVQLNPTGDLISNGHLNVTP